MMDRRRFLIGTGSLAAGAFAIFGRNAGARAELREVRRSSVALGTRVSMLALHEDEPRTSKALDAAFADLETIESVMSIYRPQSQLSQLNERGRLESPHPYLVAVLEHAQKMARESDGAF